MDQKNLPQFVKDVFSPFPFENFSQKIIMFGLPDCPDCLRIKKFFSENAVEYQYHDLETDQVAKNWLTTFVDHVPILIMLDGSLLYSPSNQELLEKINSSEVGGNIKMVEPQIFDTVIIVSGPAGIAAAIYATRKALKVLIVSKIIGGQAVYSGEVDNYPGFTMISGAQLATKFREDIEIFKGEGLWIKEGVAVISIEGEEGNFVVKTDQNLEYKAKTIIIASGRIPKFLGIRGEKELLGKGVTTCAVCDGPLYKGKDIVIVGGGNSALDAASYMQKLAKSITLINVSSDVRGDEMLIKTAKSSSNITILNNSSVSEILGQNFVEGVKIQNNDTHEEKFLKVSGVFIEIGWTPAVDFLPDQIAKDKLGQIIVDEYGKTSVPGIWAAGDVNNLWGEQIVIAAGEGAKVGLSVAEHIAKIPHQATSNIHETS